MKLYNHARRIQGRRGDIFKLALDFAPGRDKRGQTRVLVHSPRDFDHAARVVCIASSTPRGEYAGDFGVAVPLAGTGLDSQRVLLCH